MQPHEGWESVADHLRRVARGERGKHLGAEAMASVFGAGDWGELAGLWHDLGKYSDAFQDYLLHANGIERANAHIEGEGDRVDHSTFGAKHAASRGVSGWLLAYVIAGHHGGMPDFITMHEQRIPKDVEAPYAPAELLDLKLPQPPQLRALPGLSRQAFQIAFFARMIFSTLVDADFLATESVMNARRGHERASVRPPSLASLRDALGTHLGTLARRGAPSASGLVNTRRAEVLAACRARADDPPGFFSLTVPTGGGKTLSSLAFALGHACRHGLRRVVYGVPFTSIIEQNAEVFRRALAGAGPGAVLEHHVNFEPEKEDHWSRLASENWDAPLIVTTNVQLYESLFHNKPGRCRKLHNIARSVIVLDEAQTIPVNLLEPTLAALHELVRNYSCSVVLCTATQPAIVRREAFAIGLPRPTEIVSDVPALFGSLRRTAIEPIRPIGEADLARELASQPRVLCITHTKPRARSLFGLLCEEADEPSDVPLGRRACLFLTTDMCPEHRSLVIRLIRRRLRLGLACRVVSTSLIEAGVDVDFPVVYRAVAGLDSIAQAAGRCNRGGLMDRPGRVVVFEPEGKPPAYVHEAIEHTKLVARRHQGDLLSPEAIEAYFNEHYWQRSDRWDRGAKDSRGNAGQPVMECFRLQEKSRTPFVFDFRTAAERYRLIETEEIPVVVPWGRRGRTLVDRLRDLREPAGSRLRRRCQRLAVGVRPEVHKEMLGSGTIVETGPLLRGVYLLEEVSLYDKVLGLNPAAPLDPQRLIEGGIL